MISDKVEALFSFVDFLDINRDDYVKIYLPIVNETMELCYERSQLKPHANYKDKQEYDKIQTIIKQKCDKIAEEVTSPIKHKMIELGIWNGEDTFHSIYNINVQAVYTLTTTFTESDVKRIQKYKQKYEKFRIETNTGFLSLAMMFDNLDEVFKILFDFFKDSEINEFNHSKSKASLVDDFAQNFEEFLPQKTKTTFQQIAGNEIIFDLKQYSLTAQSAYSYLPRPILKEGHYFFYEGAIGKNRFHYFKIPENSTAGEFCKIFVDNYFEHNGDRQSYYEDGQKLIQACLKDAVEKAIGLPGYFKYWNDCITENEKLEIGFWLIPHFESLKDWFAIRLNKHIQKNIEQYSLSEEVKKADIEQYKEQIAEKVFEFLKNNEKRGRSQLSVVTKLHAIELIKFHDWISSTQITSLESKIKNQKLPKSIVKYIPKHFGILLKKPELINDYLVLLRNTDKPCINDKNEFMKNKGAFIVWLNALENKGCFNDTFRNDDERAATLNYNFPNLNISASLFRQANKRAKDEYKKYFDIEIASIKS